MMKEEASSVKKLQGRGGQDFLEGINQYNDLVRTVKEVGNHLGRNAVTRLRVGDENMIEWHERKGDHVFEMAEYYEKEAAKASRELYRIIGSSDPMMYSRRRVQKEGALCN